MKNRLMTMTAVATVAATLAFAGCSKQETEAAKTDASETVAQAEQKAKEAGQSAANTMREGADKAKEMGSEAAASMKEGADKAAAATREMAQDAKVAGQNAGDKIGDKVADAVITTSVKAELAKDSNLSALKIDVDTEAGRVALNGTAPTEAARERATMLATNVKGVVSVDNRLSVEPKKM